MNIEVFEEDDASEEDIDDFFDDALHAKMPTEEERTQLEINAYGAF